MSVPVARENRFNDDDDDINDSLILKEILDYTNKVYNKYVTALAEIA